MLQVCRPLLISKLSAIRVIDGQAVTPEERAYAVAPQLNPLQGMFSQDALAEQLLNGYLPGSSDRPSGNGNWPAGAGTPAPGQAASVNGALPVRMLLNGAVAPAASGAAVAPGLAGRLVAPRKLSALTGPVVLNFEALSAQLAAGAGMMAGVMGGPAMGAPVQVSVPSIQSSTLVLSGDSAFGLEGMSISGQGAVGAARPLSGKRAVGASSGAGVRGMQNGQAAGSRSRGPGVNSNMPTMGSSKTPYRGY